MNLKNRQEKRDENDDSFLEFLDGIETPVKGSPSRTPQLVCKEPSSNSFLATINKLIDKNSLIQNLLHKEIGINKDLTNENMKLKLRIQSLESCVNGIVTVEKAVREPAAPNEQESFSANNDLIVPRQVTSVADNGESPTDCAEQNIKNIKDQWKEVRIKKHKEFVFLKSLERKSWNPKKNMLLLLKQIKKHSHFSHQKPRPKQHWM